MAALMAQDGAKFYPQENDFRVKIKPEFIRITFN
jgi:hypothetical protein